MARPFSGFFQSAPGRGRRGNFVYYNPTGPVSGSNENLLRGFAPSSKPRVIGLDDLQRTRDVGRTRAGKYPPGVVLLAQVNDLEQKQREAVHTVPIHDTVSHHSYDTRRRKGAQISCGQFCLHSFAILLALGALVMVIMLATGAIRPPPDPAAWQADQRRHLGRPITSRGGLSSRDWFGPLAQSALENTHAQLRRTERDILRQQVTSRSLRSTHDQLKARMLAVDRFLKSEEENLLNFMSTSFIRWGRRECSPDNETELIYDGVAVGSLTAQTGNGHNLMCLPRRARWGSFNEEANKGSMLHGAVYRLGVRTEGTYNVFEGTPYSGRLNNQAVPCAVCRVRRASAMLVMSGTTICPDHWRRQYRGYIMSTTANGAKSTYVCVDARAERALHSRPGWGTRREGLELTPVEVKCGGLPCQIYHDNRELTCAVCAT